MKNKQDIMYNLNAVETTLCTSLDKAEITVVKRNDISSIHSVSVNGVIHNLGVLKNFSNNLNLKHFIPEKAKVSFSWVSLKSGEILNIHEHPIESMVIVTSGNVKLIGDKEEYLNAGDTVIIPRGCYHGFIGAGEEGFWGLSLQFEQRGLYENLADPLVDFVNDKKPIDKFLDENNRHIDEFDSNPLFVLMRSEVFSDPELLNRFLDCFQVFSNYFQKMIMNRVCFTEYGKFLELCELHLEDEYGHNTQLNQDRKKRKYKWDPLLEATSAWFSTKMLSLDNFEKIVLVHLVVEASACVFYKNAGFIQELKKTENKHFKLHFSDIDSYHVNMGIKYLREENCLDYTRLSLILNQGWEMLNAVFNRIAQLVLTN